MYYQILRISFERNVWQLIRRVEVFINGQKLILSKKNREANELCKQLKLCTLLLHACSIQNVWCIFLCDQRALCSVMWFLCPSFLKSKSKMTGDCCVFKFLWRRVDGKHLMRFQCETAVFKFLRRSVGWWYFSRMLVKRLVLTDNSALAPTEGHWGSHICYGWRHPSVYPVVMLLGLCTKSKYESGVEITQDTL